MTDRRPRWDISGGAGLKYRAGWGTLTGLLAYTHRDYRDSYGIDDQ